jgi:hypothetical protein
MRGEQGPGVAGEFSEVRLGDERLDRRLSVIAAKLEARPDAGFPQAMGDDAATEAFYRFISNERVTWDRLLDGHLVRTHRRAAAYSRIYAVHDSSLFQFEGDCLREGLFRTAKGKCGFLGHACIAVAADGSRRPLGMLGMIPVVRPAHGAPEDGPGKVYDNEAHRWHDLVVIVDDEVPPEVELVHVMDREGDAYEMFDMFDMLGAHFVVRLTHDRRVLTPEGYQRLSELLPDAVTKLERSVPLSRRSNRGRPPATRKTHPGRDERIAHLEVRVLQTAFVQPDGADAHAKQLTVNVVHVVEPNPPAGEEPVSWLLATTLPIDTEQEVAEVVDAYRARWLIEEFFKALKTGCAYEKRQLESFDTLLVAFSLLAPVAWRLLALRWMSRHEPERPATDLFTETEIALLVHLDNKRRKRLPANPTVQQAMFAIARLGGFLQSNKNPGWQVLGRGLIRFNDLYRGFAMARRLGDPVGAQGGEEM